MTSVSDSSGAQSPWSVTLGDVPLNIQRGGSFQWGLTYGVEPFSAKIVVDKARAEEIYKRGKPTVQSGTTRQVGNTGTRTRSREQPDDGIPLILQDGTTKIEVKRLHCLKILPGVSYDTRAVLISDIRWMFTRTLVSRNYNLRRGGLRRRLVAGQLTEPVQLQAKLADYVYRRSSLNNGATWTAEEILKDVLEELVGRGNYVVGKIKLQDQVEDLQLKGRGDAALERVLEFLPGTRVYVGLDGRIHVGQTYDRTELEVVKSVPVLSGQWQEVDNSALRAAYTDVYFDREVELRYDYQEGVTQTRQRGREPLEVENVIINPLYQLDLADGTKAAWGEAIAVDDFIAAINLRSDKPSLYKEISQSVLQEFWLGKWQALMLANTWDVTARRAIPEWTLIMSALRNHWRQTFRILPQWRDKVLKLYPRRVAVIDIENGVRAPATVHAQYIAKLSLLGLGPRGQRTLGTTGDDYAADLSSASVSPFKVNVVNSDQGIFRIEGVVDQTGLTESYILGLPNGDLPSSRPSDIAVFWNHIKLSSTFKVAVVMTAIQDSPNSVERLHRERVSVVEAARVLGIPAPRATGPSREILSTVRTAKYAWLDSAAEGIKNAFYDGKPFPQEALCNADDLEALARAEAARDLARTGDRGVGTFVGPPRAIEPTGNLQEVIWNVSAGPVSGATVTTTYNMPEEGPGLDVFSLLPEGTQRRLRNLVTDD